MGWLPAAVGAVTGLAFLVGITMMAWLRHRRLRNDRRLAVAFDRARLRRERECGERLYESTIWPAAADH
jgi:hypothetical protein